MFGSAVEIFAPLWKIIQNGRYEVPEWTKILCGWDDGPRFIFTYLNDCVEGIACLKVDIIIIWNYVIYKQSLYKNLHGVISCDSL